MEEKQRTGKKNTRGRRKCLDGWRTDGGKRGGINLQIKEEQGEHICRWRKKMSSEEEDKREEKQTKKNRWRENESDQMSLFVLGIYET